MCLESARETDFKSVQDMAFARNCLTFLVSFCLCSFTPITASGLSSDEQNQAQVGDWHGASRLGLVQVS